MNLKNSDNLMDLKIIIKRSTKIENKNKKIMKNMMLFQKPRK